jgi:hypothetical protein
VTVALGQVPKVTGELSKKDVEFLLPNPADRRIQGEADEEVDKQARVHLKQAVLGKREMTREQKVDQVAQEDG